MLFATNLLYTYFLIFGLSLHYKEFVNQKRIKILIFSVDIKFKKDNDPTSKMPCDIATPMLGTVTQPPIKL